MKKIITFITALLMAATIQAQETIETPYKESGVYLGFSVGSSKADADEDYVFFTEDNDTSYTFKFGAKFNKYVAMEMRYNDFGTYTVGVCYYYGCGYSDIDAKALTWHVVGNVPFGESGFGLYLQGGFGLGYLDDGYEDDDYAAGSAGLGISYSQGPVTVLLAYDAYAFDADADPTFGNASLGLTYTF
jgi:hypothetical protein